MPFMLKGKKFSNALLYFKIFYRQLIRHQKLNKVESWNLMHTKIAIEVRRY